MLNLATSYRDAGAIVLLPGIVLSPIAFVTIPTKDVIEDCTSAQELGLVLNPVKGSAVIDANFINECPQEFYLKVNQKIRQEGNLKDMIFSFEDIILHLSKTIDFKKGDIIFSGTPGGVGALESGDQIEMGFNNYPPKKLVVI